MERAAASQKANITTPVTAPSASRVLVAVRRHIHCRVHCRVHRVCSEHDTGIGGDSSPDVNVEGVKARHHHLDVLLFSWRERKCGWDKEWMGCVGTFSILCFRLRTMKKER